MHATHAHTHHIQHELQIPNQNTAKWRETIAQYPHLLLSFRGPHGVTIGTRNLHARACVTNINAIRSAHASKHSKNNSKRNSKANSRPISVQNKFIRARTTWSRLASRLSHVPLFTRFWWNLTVSQTRHKSSHQTPNPKPHTPNPKPQTLNPKPALITCPTPKNLSGAPPGYILAGNIMSNIVVSSHSHT